MLFSVGLLVTWCVGSALIIMHYCTIHMYMYMYMYVTHKHVHAQTIVYLVSLICCNNCRLEQQGYNTESMTTIIVMIVHVHLYMCILSVYMYTVYIHVHVHIMHVCKYTCTKCIYIHVQCTCTCTCRWQVLWTSLSDSLSTWMYRLKQWKRPWVELQRSPFQRYKWLGAYSTCLACVCVSVRLSVCVCLSVCLCLSPSVCLSVCLSVGWLVGLHLFSHYWLQDGFSATLAWFLKWRFSCNHCV